LLYFTPFNKTITKEKGKKKERSASVCLTLAKEPRTRSNNEKNWQKVDY